MKYSFCLMGESEIALRWKELISNDPDIPVIGKFYTAKHTSSCEEYAHLYSFYELMHQVRVDEINGFAGNDIIILIDADELPLADWEHVKQSVKADDSLYLEIHNNPYSFRGQVCAYARTKVIGGTVHSMLRASSAYLAKDNMGELENTTLENTVEEVALFCHLRNMALLTVDIERREKEQQP